MHLKLGAILFLALGLLLLVFTGGEVTLLFLLFLIVLISLAFILNFRALACLSLERRIFPAKVTSGEEVGIELKIQNKSSFPIIWLEIRDHLPPYMVPREGQPFFALILRPHECRILRYRAQMNKRGEYNLSPLHVSLGDPWGIWRKESRIRALATVIVYPRIFPISTFRVPLKKPFEGKKASIRSYEDYTALAGVREYFPQDPPKRIHWKLTAHSGNLLVKEFDFLASTTLALWLDLVSAGHSLEFMEIYAEYASMVAASILNKAMAEHIPTLLEVFPTCRRSDLGQGESHFLYQMEILARVKAEQGNLVDCLQLSSTHLPWRCNLILISSILSPELVLKLEELRLKTKHLSIYLLYEGFFLLPGEKPRYHYQMDPIEITKLKKMAGILEKQNVALHLLPSNLSWEEVG